VDGEPFAGNTAVLGEAAEPFEFLDPAAD